MGSTGNKTSKYLKIALRLAAVAAVLAVIYFIIRIYTFTTIRLESSVYHILALELRGELAKMDIPDGKIIKDIPIFKLERLRTEDLVKDGKYVDRWGNPLDIKFVKEGRRFAITIVSRGRGRWFFSRDDIEVTQKGELPDEVVEDRQGGEHAPGKQNEDQRK